MVTSGSVAPVLAALQRRGLCRFGLAQRGGRERLRNFVGMDRDQADRFFRRQRAEPLLHLAGGKAEAARAHQIDADEIAVLGAVGVGLGDVQFAAGLLLVDRHQPSAAVGQRAEDAEHAGLGVIDHLDDAAAIGGAFAVVRLLDRAAARGRRRRPRCPAAGGAEHGCGFSAARRFPLRPIRLGVAINSPSLSRPVMSAITVGGSAAGSLDLLAALGDRAFVGEFAQDAFQFGAVGVLQAEFARDLAGADFSGMRADEGDDGVPAPESRCRVAWPLYPLALPALSSRTFWRRAWRAWPARSWWPCTGARALLAASDFRLCRGFFRDRLLDRLRRLGTSACDLGGLCRLWPSWRRASACRHPSPRARRSARWLPASVMVSWRLVARDRGVDAAGRDIGAVAAALDRDRRRGSDDRRAACRDRRRSGGRSGPLQFSRRSASPRD